MLTHVPAHRIEDPAARLDFALETQPVLFAPSGNDHWSLLSLPLPPDSVALSQLPQIVHEYLALHFVRRLERVAPFLAHQDELTVLQFFDVQYVAELDTLLPPDRALQAGKKAQGGRRR